MLRSHANQRRWDLLCLTLAIGLAAHIFWRNALLASRVIDGVRWWYLDDDMMISMRYGRNLAEGHGLVWNEGERVEGYTNFLWTMVMAAIHKLGAQDRTAALWMRTIGFGLLSGVLIQSVRILRVFTPRSFLAPPAMLVAALFCADVMWWAAWGFESSLLTFLFLTFLVGVLRDPKSVGGWIALSLVPLVRADGIHIFLSSAFVGLVLASDRKECARRIVFAALPVVLHFAFRRAYYGEWFPNTYYLKVFRLDNAGGRGLDYAFNFIYAYPVPIALACGGALAIARRDRRALLFFVLFFGTLVYVSRTGGDMMGNFRFCAHLMPLIFTFAAAGVAHVAQNQLARVVWIATLASGTFPFVQRLDRVIAFNGNGDPREQIVVANVINKNALPESSIAVIAAGIVPYFTRRYAIDILGKSDKHIARLKPFPGAMVGHGKLDPDYTLGTKHPDIVVSCRNIGWVNGLRPGARTHDPVFSFLSSTAFISAYRPNPIQEEFTLNATGLFTHAGSAEASRRRWQSVSASPWP